MNSVGTLLVCHVMCKYIEAHKPQFPWDFPYILISLILPHDDVYASHVKHLQSAHTVIHLYI